MYLVIYIMPCPSLAAVRIDGGHQMDVSRVHKHLDLLIIVISIAQVPKGRNF